MRRRAHSGRSRRRDASASSSRAARVRAHARARRGRDFHPVCSRYARSWLPARGRARRVERRIPLKARLIPRSARCTTERGSKRDWKDTRRVSLVPSRGTMRSRHRRVIAFVCFSVFVGCRGSTGPQTERAAELLAVRAPSSVDVSSTFAITAFYGRGACDAAHAIREPSSSGVHIGLRLTSNVPSGTAYVGILLSDSVRVEVAPP